MKSTLTFITALLLAPLGGLQAADADLLAWPWTAWWWIGALPFLAPYFLFPSVSIALANASRWDSIGSGSKVYFLSEALTSGGTLSNAL